MLRPRLTRLSPGVTTAKRKPPCWSAGFRLATIENVSNIVCSGTVNTHYNTLIRYIKFVVIFRPWIVDHNFTEEEKIHL